MISIDRQNIIDVMKSINFIEVIPPLQFNYEKELSFWLDKDRFILFRSNFNVDNYIAIDIQKGKTNSYLLQSVEKICPVTI